jgi:DNA-binding transcriptional LysR family regulator
MFDWDDLRLFLGAAREGSTLRAAQKLGVNQTTVARRLGALEHGLGVTLFERSPRGYRLTIQGEALVPRAEAVEAATLSLQAEAARLLRDVSCAIRVTATHPIMTHLVGPVIRAYRTSHPEVTFEVLSTTRHLNLDEGEADIAFRSARSLTGDTLIATRLPDIMWTFYCAENYRGCGAGPTGADDLADHDVLVYTGTPVMGFYTDWFRSQTRPLRIAGTANSPEDMVGLILSGLGVSFLPCFLGDATPGLRRCFAPPPEFDRPWWLVASRAAYEQPYVRTFMAFAAERLRLEAAGVRRSG